MENESMQLVAPNSLEAARTIAASAFQPKDFAELGIFAEAASKSDLIPAAYKGKAGNIMIAVQMGAELGLPPIQSLQNIAVINGRPAIWGDAIPGLGMASGKIEWVRESSDDEIEKTGKAWCEIKRRNYPEPFLRSFSRADAKQAGLSGKAGPWTQYEKRMLLYRARAFAYRDAVPDVLRGLSVAEEAMDIPQQEPMPARPQIQMPQPKAAAAVTFEAQVPSGEAQPVGDDPVYVRSVESASGVKKNGNAWTKWKIGFSNEVQASTFHASHGEAAERAKEEGLPVRFSTVPAKDPKYLPEIMSLEIAYPDSAE